MEQMKNGCAYISSLIIFVYYLRVHLFAGCFPAKQKYLPIFATFCEHEKNAICKCFLSYSVNCCGAITCLLAGGKRANVRFVCLLLACGLQIFVNYANISKRKESR